MTTDPTPTLTASTLHQFLLNARVWSSNGDDFIQKKIHPNGEEVQSWGESLLAAPKCTVPNVRCVHPI